MPENTIWHQSEARTAATVWNWSGKTLSPGALLAVLYFSSCYIFFRPFRLFLVPTICPWVSEDEDYPAMFASPVISGLVPLCFKANQNKPLTTRALDPRRWPKGSKLCEREWTHSRPHSPLGVVDDILILFFLVLCEVMFPVFLTLLLADITWTAGKYFILKSFLP